MSAAKYVWKLPVKVNGSGLYLSPLIRTPTPFYRYRSITSNSLSHIAFVYSLGVNFIVIVSSEADTNSQSTFRANP